jgi:hypothetical protein
MKLITKEIARKIPLLYATEKIPTAEKKVPLKLFAPWNQWTWYIIEGAAMYESGDEIIEVALGEADLTDPTLLDVRFFGYVVGQENELGYISLNELKAVRHFSGLKVERDLRWNPSTTLESVMK